MWLPQKGNSGVSVNPVQPSSTQFNPIQPSSPSSTELTPVQPFSLEFPALCSVLNSLVANNEFATDTKFLIPTSLHPDSLNL